MTIVIIIIIIVIVNVIMIIVYCRDIAEKPPTKTSSKPRDLRPQIGYYNDITNLERPIDIFFSNSMNYI